jgi:hypothetical protein
LARTPAAPKHATVLGRVKGKPAAPVLRTLDPSCARRHLRCAWPGRRNGSGRTKKSPALGSGDGKRGASGGLRPVVCTPNPRANVLSTGGAKERLGAAQSDENLDSGQTRNARFGQSKPQA